MQGKLLLYIQTGLFALCGIAVICMPFVEYTVSTMNTVFSVIIGVAFWAGLLGGIICDLLLSKKRKAASAQGGRPGIITFFSNRLAKIADIAAAISFAASVAVLVSGTTAAAGAIALGMFVFSFAMHCVLNGKNYHYITNSTEEKNNG